MEVWNSTELTLADGSRSFPVEDLGKDNKMFSVNDTRETDQLGDGLDSEEKASGLYAEDNGESEKRKQLESYLDMVRKTVKPGCSHEVLNMALNSMSSLVSILSFISSNPKFRASL